jgi:hypothetical protein
MVSRLYKIIEKDGLRDPYSNLPAVNFIKRESFVQKLHLHAQEFQMALIILEECFMKHVEHHKDDVFLLDEENLPLLPKTCGRGDPLQSAMVPVSQWQ